MYRPQKVRLKSNDWRSVFLWLNIAMNLRKKLWMLMLKFKKLLCCTMSVILMLSLISCSVRRVF